MAEVTTEDVQVVPAVETGAKKTETQEMPVDGELQRKLEEDLRGDLLEVRDMALKATEEEGKKKKEQVVAGVVGPEAMEKAAA